MKAQHFLNMARRISAKSGHHQYKMGCVIARKGKILGTGFNMLRTHPKSPHSFKLIHAEFMAAINAGYKIEGATVYVFREQRDGMWTMAKPCKDCWKFLKELGVKQVVYSFQGSFITEKIS